jgi:hypothetical protein
LVAKYRSLIRLLKLRSDRFNNRFFFTLRLKISVSKSVAIATEIFRLLNRLLKAKFLVVYGIGPHKNKGLKKIIE